MNSGNVILEEHHGVEGHALSLANGVTTRDQFIQVLQMKILNMIPHVGNAFEGAGPFVVCIPLVPDAEDALGLAQNEGKLVKLREGIGRRGVGGCVRPFFNWIQKG